MVDIKKSIDALSDEQLNKIFVACCEAQEKGELTKARAGYEFLLNRFHDVPILLCNIGMVCLEQEDFDNAIFYFAKAFALTEDTDVLFNLSLARKQQDDIAGAMDGFRKIIEKEPKAVDVLYNLGGCHQKKREIEEAVSCYQQVIVLAPDYSAAHNSLAYLYHLQGEKELAIQYYQQVIALEPEHSGAKYMLSVLQGDPEVKAPPKKYVKELFDQYAESFEESLVEELDYQAPALLSALCRRVLPEDFYVQRLLDLGCGTGLSGKAFEELAQRLDGVDISGKMLEVARAKEIYTKLYKEDIGRFLAKGSEKYDFFLACDVFNYLGRLEDVFAVITVSSAPEAYLCFTSEESSNDDFWVQENGRFSHNSKYIRTLLEKHNYTLLAHEKDFLRRERDGWVVGSLWLAQLGRQESS